MQGKLSSEDERPNFGDTLETVPKHECISNNLLSERCHFCRICGVYLINSLSNQRNPAGHWFFRSRRFSMLDPTCSNSNNILEQMIARQSVNRYYNVCAQNLHRRAPLIDWMQGLCQSLHYSLTTFYLAVAYLDAIFSLYIIKEGQLKLIGYISIYMAAKMEEEDSKILTIKQTVRMFREEFTEEEVVNCEKFMFKILGYNASLKTPFAFLMFFFSKGFICGSDLQGLKSQDDIWNYIENIEKLAIFLMDVSVKNYEFYQFTSIAIAATAIACARKCVGIRSWSSDLEKLTFVSWDAIKDCRKMMLHNFEGTYPEMYSSFFPEGGRSANSPIESPLRIPHQSPQGELELEDGQALQPGTEFEQNAKIRTPLKRRSVDCQSTKEARKFSTGLDEEEFGEDQPKKFELEGESRLSQFQLEDNEDASPNTSQGVPARVFGMDIKNIGLRKEDRK